MKNIKITACLAMLLLASLACNAATGIRAAQTDIPAMMTSAPTVLGPLETAAAKVTPDSVLTAIPLTSNTPIPGTLGIALADVKTVMGITQQFSFKDSSVGGKPATTATLTSTAAATFPLLADGFSAVFIGDPANLTEIRISVPRSNDKATVEQGTALLSLLFASILPATVQPDFLPWLTENYPSLPVGGTKELSSGNLKFSLSRDQANLHLDVTPLK
jgi:hypothetical protein